MRMVQPSSMRGASLVSWLWLGMACPGCADLLGANFDGLGGRPDPGQPQATDERGSPGSGGPNTAFGARSGREDAGSKRPDTEAEPYRPGRDDPIPLDPGGGDEPGMDRGKPVAPAGEDGMAALPEGGSDQDPPREMQPEDADLDAGTPGVPPDDRRSDPGAFDATGESSDLPDPDHCAASQPFVRVERLLGMEVHSSRIRLSDDELTAYFGWVTESQSLDLHLARRPDRSTPFSPREPLAELNAPVIDTSPSLSADGSMLYFESSRLGRFRIFQSARDPETGALSPPTEVSGIGITAASDGGPYLHPTTGDLYFHSTRAGFSELYRAPRIESGFGVALPLIGVNDPEQGQGFPLVSADGLSLYFTRVDSDLADGDSSYDIWMATRDDASREFENPRPLSELNSAVAEIPDWISPDGCRLYFSVMPIELWWRSVVYVAVREPGAASEPAAEP